MTSDSTASRGWSVEVELDAKAKEMDADDFSDLHDKLTEHHPAVGTALSGNLSVRVTVDEPIALEAASAAVSVVTTATRELRIPGAVVGIEVVTEEELDRRLDS